MRAPCWAPHIRTHSMGGPEWVIILSCRPGITSPAGAISTRNGIPSAIRPTASSFAFSIFCLISIERAFRGGTARKSWWARSGGPPGSISDRLLLGAADHPFDEPVDRAHQVGREHLAFGDPYRLVLIHDGAAEDHDLPRFNARPDLGDLVLYFLRDLRSKRSHGHAAVGDAAAQEDRLPGPVDHVGTQPGQRVAQGIADSRHPELRRKLLGSQRLEADGVHAPRFGGGDDRSW